jgi:hypothetical protein
MLAQTLQVLNEMSGRIDFEIAYLADMGSTPSAASLVGQNDLVDRWVKITPVLWNASRPGPTMKIHSGATARIAGAFPIDLLGIADGEHAALERLDVREHPQLFGEKEFRYYIRASLVPVRV